MPGGLETGPSADLPPDNAIEEDAISLAPYLRDAGDEPVSDAGLELPAGNDEDTPGLSWIDPPVEPNGGKEKPDDLP